MFKWLGIVAINYKSGKIRSNKDFISTLIISYIRGRIAGYRHYERLSGNITIINYISNADKVG